MMLSTKNVVHSFFTFLVIFLFIYFEMSNPFFIFAPKKKTSWDSPKRIRVSLLGMCRLMPDGGNST